MKLNAVAHRFTYVHYTHQGIPVPRCHICYCYRFTNRSTLKHITTRKPHGQAYAAHQLQARMHIVAKRERIVQKTMDILDDLGAFSFPEHTTGNPYQPNCCDRPYPDCGIWCGHDSKFIEDQTNPCEPFPSPGFPLS